MNRFCIALARPASPEIAAGGNDLYIAGMFISSTQVYLLTAGYTVADLNWILLTSDKIGLRYKQGRDFL
jgi:hypothetical protein